MSFPNRDGKPPTLHDIDGRMITVDEIAKMLGTTRKGLYVRRSRLGGCSYQLIVRMWREGQIGNDGKHRYLIEGRWRTTEQIAEELRVKPHTLSTWRYDHRQPNGKPALMEDAVAYYRQYLTGEKKRYQDMGGGRPWKEYKVGQKTVTVKDVMTRFGVAYQSVNSMLTDCDRDMGRVIEHYKARERRRKDIERRKIEQAERKILRILRGG